MTMYVAFNENKKLVHIKDVMSGLSCGCVCFECGERVLARKGDINEHHFAHFNNKESCIINAESVLHKYAKQVILDAKSIVLPAIPNQEAEISCWTFEKILPEFHLGLIRPDLVAYKDNQPIFIEIAVTHFMDHKKIDIIRAMGVKTIEIDLSFLLKSTEINIPSIEAEKVILESVDNKIWKFPHTPTAVLEKIKDTQIEQDTIDQKMTTDSLNPWDDYRFKVNGIWVDVRHFSSGMLSLRCIYNPELIAIFKQWSREGGGKYNKDYRSWNYWKPFSETVFSRLEEMHSLDTP